MRRISFPLALGLLVAGFLACDGSSLTIQETCNQVMAAMCQRMSDCGELGTTSVADCTKAMQAGNCTSASISLACPSGTTFHASQAQKCIDEQKSQSCTDLDNGLEPNACTLVCTAGGTGGTGGGGSGNGNAGSGGTGGTGGTTTPGTLGALDACKETMALMCQKTSTCFGTTALTDLGYASVAACTTEMQADGCADVTQTSCDDGQTYHADQAKACLSALPSISCTDFAGGTFPSSCNLMCQ